MKLKIYGERNSGTQFVRELLLTNGCDDLWPGTVAELGEGDRVAATDRPDLPARDRAMVREAVIDDIFAGAFDQTLGWKHGVPDPARLGACGAGTTAVITVKNPYAWVVSMFRRPHHNLLTGNLGSIESFVGAPWITCGRDNLRRHLGSIVEVWTLKYRAWLALAPVLPTIVLRYEDLLLDPAALDSLARRLQTERTTPWRLPVRVANNPEDLDTYRRFYAERRWLDALTPREIDLIDERLDDDLLARLGYARTTSRDQAGPAPPSSTANPARA